ncbi:2-isopropylmalate synthase [Smittium mucronatum]|uniref:2-isopropylmalate synthase n=1 Tax=Smittium mucronatum TaxID=133383 RepID=A0A1R0H860_9FUNG|nr:2-isopropylmalate synthase [Smittium mucronatum]
MQKEKLIILDTSLRDGEQSPGVTLNVEEKVAIAKQLSRLGVDVIEAGFPIASPGDFLAVEKIAQEVGSLMEGREAIGKPAVICGFARALKKDIQAVYDAVKIAKHHRIHVSIATSDIHLEHKLKISREKCLEKAVEAVSFSKSLCEDVEFGAEDASRSDPIFLIKILGAVIDAGATTINIPDTVGYKTPAEFGNLIKYVVDNTVGAKDVIWSVHCHDDLGLATANTLAGISNGARQVEVTINGIGERAGNAALEEIVMNISTRASSHPVFHDINTRLLSSISKMVSDMTGMLVQPNKAIVGKNAFLHESGIHQDGILKNRETYEIINPEDVGVLASKFHLGKHSGRHAIQFRLEELGYSPSSFSSEQKDKLLAKFKKIADCKRSGVTNSDLHEIVCSILSLSLENTPTPYELPQTPL